MNRVEPAHVPGCLRPHSHCAGVATVHPDAGQQVYRDAPGHISRSHLTNITPVYPRSSGKQDAG